MTYHCRLCNEGMVDLVSLKWHIENYHRVSTHAFDSIDYMEEDD